MTAGTRVLSRRLAPLWGILNQLDGLGIFTWGILILKYSFSGKLKLLIHPNYFALVTVTGFILLSLGGLRLFQTMRRWLRRSAPPQPDQDSVTHVTVLPLGIGTLLLLSTAILGLLISPSVFTSQLAIQRGISNTLPPTQAQAESFASQVKPEDRTLVDWIRTINAYPEPDVYAGQPANVTGFVVYPDYLPDNYLLISRFILTCCAVDVYPVALPVKLEGSRQQYPQDTWLEIQGEMVTETLPTPSGNQGSGSPPKRQLVLAAKSLQTIPTPKDPYSYAD